MLVDYVHTRDIVTDAWACVIDCAYCDTFMGYVKCFEDFCSP